MSESTPLTQAAELVQKELPAYMGPGFTISHVTSDDFEYKGEVYNHIHVYFQPGHPKVEPRVVVDFDLEMEDRFLELGLCSPPTISYGDSE